MQTLHPRIVSMRRMCRTFDRAWYVKCSVLPCGTVLCMQRLQYRNLPGSFFPAAQSWVVAVTFSWSLPCNSRPKPFSPHYEHASNAAFAATSIIVRTGVHDQVQAWGFGILQLTKLVRCLARGLKLATTSTIHRRETTHTRRLGVSNNDKLCVCTEW